MPVNSMLAKISSSIKDSQTIKDLQPFVQYLFNLDELKKVLLQQIENKYNTNSKIKDKTTNNDNEWTRDAAICKTYFNTRSLTQIFPNEIIVKMIEYLDTRYYEIFVVLSKTFQSMIYHSHCLFASV